VYRVGNKEKINYYKVYGPYFQNRPHIPDVKVNICGFTLSLYMAKGTDENHEVLIQGSPRASSLKFGYSISEPTYSVLNI